MSALTIILYDFYIYKMATGEIRTLVQDMVAVVVVVVTLVQWGVEIMLNGQVDLMEVSFLFQSLLVLKKNSISNSQVLKGGWMGDIYLFDAFLYEL